MVRRSSERDRMSVVTVGTAGAGQTLVPVYGGTEGAGAFARYPKNVKG
jgi:hypothetical protein